MNNVFTTQFTQNAQTILRQRCVEGACIPRIELAQELRSSVAKGRKNVEEKDLEVWVGHSVALSLFDHDNTRYYLKRGVKGGIAAKTVKARKKTAAPVAPSA